MVASRLALFEAENTLRVMRVARKLTTAQVELALDALKRVVMEGFIEHQEVPIKRLYPEAGRLSQHHNRHQGELAPKEAKA